MTNPDSLGDPPQVSPELELRVQAVVEEALAKLQNGEVVDIDGLCAAHPDLAVELRPRLAFVENVFRQTRQAAESMDNDMLASTQAQSSDPKSPIRAERLLRLTCPHCQTDIGLVDQAVVDITCRVCGSTIHLDTERTAPFTFVPHPERFGRFKVQEVLGRGGFGIVYKAQDTELGRSVALKVPRAGYFLTLQDEERFLREARHVARLRHPRIVPVFEVGREADLPFIVSEFIDGFTLADWISSRRVDFRQTVELMIPVAEAVEYSHREQVIHRDLKPANILLDRQLNPFVTDFGLARAEGAEFTITVAGEILGTPSYMSPEQIVGDQSRVDARSDVYSLGAILYRMFCGELPFRGGKRLILHQILHDEPRPPRLINEFVPRDLETIALKAMSKVPTRRYQTAQELADDLRRWRNGEPIRARPVGRLERGWRWCRRRPAIAGLVATILVLLVAGASGGVAWGWRERDLRGQVQSALALEQTERTRADENGRESQRRLARSYTVTGVQHLQSGDYLNSLPWLTAGWKLDRDDLQLDSVHRLRMGMVLEHCPQLVSVQAHDFKAVHAALSPDGRLAASGFEDGAVLLWEVASGRSIGTLRHQGEVTHVAFSPDGKRLATASIDRTVQVWDTATGDRAYAPMTFEDRMNIAIFSPDGTQLLTGGKDHRATLWNAATGERIARLQHDIDVKFAGFSPDGTKIWTVAWQSHSEPCAVRLWDVAAGTPREPPFKHDGPVTGAIMRRDGKRLITFGEDRTVRIWNLEVEGTDARVLPHKSEVVTAFFVNDDNHVLTVSRDGQVQSWNAESGEKLETVLDLQEHIESATLSGGGQFLALAGRARSASVWRLSPLEPIGPPLPHLYRVVGASFANDGQLVMTYGDDGVVKVWKPDVPYISAPRLTHESNVRSIEISPSGKKAVTCTGLTAVIWAVPAGKTIGEPFRHPHHVMHADFSPNESLVATACADGMVRIWNLATGALVGMPFKHSKGVLSVRFTPDGQSVLAKDFDHSLRRWDLQTGQMRFEIRHDNQIASFDISPNGERLATASRDGTARVWNLEDGRPTSPPLRHMDKQIVLRCRFSPDSRFVITAAQDRTAVVWDATTGAPITEPLRHRGSVLDAGFSLNDEMLVTTGKDGEVVIWSREAKPQQRAVLQPFGATVFRSEFLRDGNLLATVSYGPVANSSLQLHAAGGVQIWDANLGDLVSPLLRHRTRVSSMAHSPDGSFVMSADEEGLARIWKLTSETRDWEVVDLWAMLLSGRRIDAMAGSVPLTATEIRAIWNRLRTNAGGL